MDHKRVLKRSGAITCIFTTGLIGSSFVGQLANGVPIGETRAVELFVDGTIWASIFGTVWGVATVSLVVWAISFAARAGCAWRRGRSRPNAKPWVGTVTAICLVGTGAVSTAVLATMSVSEVLFGGDGWAETLLFSFSPSIHAMLGVLCAGYLALCALVVAGGEVMVRGRAEKV